MATKGAVLDPQPDTSTVGGRLRAARVLSGLSLRAAAQRIGMSHNTIAWYERHNCLPPLETLGLLVVLYGVSVRWLWDGTLTPEAEEALARLDPLLGALPQAARERLALVVSMSPWGEPFHTRA